MIDGLKPYPEYKDSGSRWLGMVPASWEIHNLRTLITRQNERKRKAKSKWKSIKVGGTTLKYQRGGDPSTAKLVRNLAAGLKRRAKTEKARAEAVVARPAPNLTTQPYLVAFIDILGFGRVIESAETVDDLQKAYAMIRTVQEEFQHPSAANGNQMQVELNQDYGRRVIALSDAVVVAITPKCNMTPIMGGYDLLGFAISDLLSAQARCLAKGIFVRGGVSHGSFFYENDILLSPAMARAYELESKFAEYPLIVVPESTRQAIFKTPKMGSYAPGADPMPEFFKKHDRTWKRKDLNWNEQDLYYLDYISVLRDEADFGWQKKDLEKYRAARKKHDDKRAQVLFNRRCLKSAACALGIHKKRLIDAYNATSDECVRRKYRWLMKYHNQSFRHDLPHIGQQIIDLSKFPEQNCKITA